MTAITEGVSPKLIKFRFKNYIVDEVSNERTAVCKVVTKPTEKVV